MAATTLPENTRSQLAGLHERAGTSAEAQTEFENTLAAFHAAGWTHRQLGAAIGTSHEFVRGSILRAADAKPAPGVEVPDRLRPSGIIPVRKLPAEISADLTARLDAAVTDPSPERDENGIKPAVGAFFAALHMAREAGWDPYSISHGTGIHPGAIHKFIAHHERHQGNFDNPGYQPAPEHQVPLTSTARYAPVPPLEIPAGEAGQLQQLRDEAHLNRGVDREQEDSALRAALDYTHRIAGWYLRGATREALTAATGQGWETIRKRLSRWGFMTRTGGPPRHR